MKKRDLDDLFASAATTIGEDFEASQRHRLQHVHDRVVIKARRRRVVKASGTVVTSVGIAVALFAAPIRLPFMNGPGAPMLPNYAAGSASSAEGVGFWPYITEQQTAETCPEGTSGLTSMQYPDATSSEFVGAYLGWTNSAMFDREREGDHHIKQHVGNFPSTFAGGGTPDSPNILLELSRIDDRRCWWVTGVSDPEDDAGISVVVKDGTLEATWDLSNGAERADLIVVHGENATREFVAGDEGSTSATVEGFEGPGFALVVWKGADGTIFSASGVTLPEGDAQATST
jgi:hypothetical protein